MTNVKLTSFKGTQLPKRGRLNWIRSMASFYWKGAEEKTEKNVTKEMVNNVFRSNQSRCLKYTEDPVVSSDIIGEPYGGLVDGLLTNVVECDGKQLVKVVAWYDNEVGYTAQMIRTMKLFI